MSHPTTPRVSVLLPCYNAEQYLDLCLRSLSTQTFRDYEIVALDDGSTDSTLAILQRAAARDSRVRVYSRENRGLIDTLNELINLATGEYLARMDADDIAYADRLAKQVAAMDAAPELSLLASDFDSLEAGNRAVRAPCHLVRDQALRVAMTFYCAISHPTVMFRGHVLREEAVFYDRRYPHAEDFELFNRLSRQHAIGQVHEKLIGWRTNHNSVRSRHRLAMRHTHMRIVEEELCRKGVSVATGCFSTLFAADGPPEASRLLGPLAQAMSAIADGGPLRAGAADVYDYSLQIFLNEVLAPQITSRLGQRALNRLVAESGLRRHLWKRHRRYLPLGEQGTAYLDRLLERRRIWTRQAAVYLHGFDAAAKIPPAAPSSEYATPKQADR